MSSDEAFFNITSPSNCTRVEAIENFHTVYKSIHVNICLVWCPLGVISNLLNVIVLNCKSMRTPTNFLLKWLALSDGMIMLLYIPFAAYFLRGGYMPSAVYPMAVYLLLYINLQNALHIFSCGIIVTLAVFRLLYARCLLKCQVWCSHQRAVIAVIVVMATATLLTVPCMLAHRIRPVNITEEVGYMVNYVDNKNLHLLLYWNTAIFVKMVPLTCFLVLSSLLIATIHARVVHIRAMSRRNTTKAKASNERSVQSVQERTDYPDTVDPFKRLQEVDKNRDRSTSRTTNLLLAVMIVYIFTFTPQVVLLLLSAFLGICFSETVYDPLGDFMDLLTLLSCGVNFVLYCSMSQQFRQTFLKMFFCRRN